MPDAWTRIPKPTDNGPASQYTWGDATVQWGDPIIQWGGVSTTGGPGWIKIPKPIT